MASETQPDVQMGSPPPAPPSTSEPKYGGYSRFEIELEFVQSLANPYYLNHLASQKLLTQPAFVAYLAYLQYWSKPPYLKYLIYPGPTLRHLELLQQPLFREQIMSPDIVQRLVDEEMKAAVEWHRWPVQRPEQLSREAVAVVQLQPSGSTNMDFQHHHATNNKTTEKSILQNERANSGTLLNTPFKSPPPPPPQPYLLILSPSVPTRHALIETRHRLISTANLNLEESRLIAIAAPSRALHLALLGVVPGARPAEDVLALDALVKPPREDGLRDVVLEGAGAALESVRPRVSQRDGEDVGAMRTDCRGGPGAWVLQPRCATSSTIPNGHILRREIPHHVGHSPTYNRAATHKHTAVRHDATTSPASSEILSITAHHNRRSSPPPPWTASTMGDEEHEGASAKEILIEACRRNNVDLLTECLEGKDDAEISALLNGTTTIMGNHLYHEAASRGNYEIIDHLLDQPDFECDPLTRQDGDTPLHTAIRWLNGEPAAQRPFGLALVEMMLEAGSNPRVKNKGGLTAYQLVDPRNTELRDLIQKHEYANQNAGDFITVDTTGGGAKGQPQQREEESDEDAEFSGSDDEERAEWERRRRERRKR
ncbi:hypothetical protein G7046_g8560 [Stylonectria norvegica]|nr:hypothetical protein G7046_g8560 [Stylonectria norvegica]